MKWTNDGLQRLRPSDFPIGQFPGYRDTGSPLVIESRGTGRMTIIGMFREQLDENGKFSSFMKMALLSKIHPDAWNWIVNCADWTEDDQCTKHTSCSCGIEANSETDLFNNRYVCLKITVIMLLTGLTGPKKHFQGSGLCQCFKNTNIMCSLCV